jgi:flavin-dependent dehydrogenase
MPDPLPTPVPRTACVVGGGPAGAVSAAVLARHGWQVTLVERQPLPRTKCCGECLVPRAAAWLAELGLGEALEQARAGSTREVRMLDARAGNAHPVWTHAFGGQPGVIVPRAAFDAALRDGARRAGAEINAGRGVKLVRAGGDEGAQVGTPAVVTITTLNDPSVAPRDLHFDLVVAADGVGSAIARAAGLAPTTVGSRAGWSFTFERCTDDHTLAPEGTIELILFGSAYVGLVRRGDAVHMAAIVERGDRWPTAPAEALRMMATRAPQLARFLAHYEASQPMPALEAACGPLPWKPRAVTAGRVALVGDAAGYAEPYTGEGMGWAIEGAMLLGECFRDGWTAAAAAEYQRRWRATVGRAQAHNLRVGMLLRGGRVAAHATRAAVKMAPWAARRASEIVVGA